MLSGEVECHLSTTGTTRRLKMILRCKLDGFLFKRLKPRSVVIGQHFTPCYCRVSVELGRGKSLICITVE